MKQKDIVEFQMLQSEMNQTQELLQKLDEQRAHVMKLIDDLEEFQKLSTGEEVLFPVTNGIFAKGTLADSVTLHVNVGRGIVVPRTAEETQNLVKEQLDDLTQQQELVAQQQQTIFTKLEELEKKVSTEMKDV